MAVARLHPMWTKVGQFVCNSASGVGVITLKHGAYISRQGYGRFIVVRNDIVPRVVNLRSSAWEILQRVAKRGGRLAAEAEDLLFRIRRQGGRARSASL